MKIISRPIFLLILTGLCNSAYAITFSALHDTDVTNTAKDDNFGADNALFPFTHANNNTKIYSYIEFDISSFQQSNLPASSVSLDLYTFGTRNNPLDLNIFGLNDTILSNWTETALTWNTASGIGTNDEIDTSEAALLESVSVLPHTNNSKLTFFGSNAFVDFINADTDGFVSLILMGLPSSNNHAFSSKESSGNPPIGSPGDFAPRLNITPVPLPAAFWLFSSGFLGLIALIRKQKYIYSV